MIVLHWLQIPLGALQTNCYVLFHGEVCLIIDPGGEGEKLIDWLKNNNKKPLAILLTHTHFDHIGAVDLLREHYQIPVYVHRKEEDWLENPLMNGSALFFPDRPLTVKKADKIIEQEGKLSIGPFQIKVFETPGHSPGSISFYLEEKDVLFAGDTLFYGSIGRTDLPGGSMEQLLQAIKTKIFTLPEKTTVLPGHGPETTVIREKQYNPFFQ